MPAPGENVTVVDSPPPNPATVDTSTAFVVGLSHKGSADAPITVQDPVHSLDEWVDRFGDLQSYNGTTYDTVEGAFADGVSTLYFSRQVGPGAVKASAAVPATGSQFTAVAKGPGLYANGLKVQVSSGVITVLSADGNTTLETFPQQADAFAAQEYARVFSRQIDVVPLATGALNDTAPVSLTGGTDDRGNITDVQRQAALDRFTADLGSGQVSMPGDTRAAAHLMLARHAAKFNRFAYGDGAESASTASVIASAAALRTAGLDPARHIQVLDGWVLAPPIATGAPNRFVPPSAIMLGLAARIDSAGNPNNAVAGNKAVSRWAIGVRRSRTDSDRSALADAGVTPILNLGGLVQPFDDVTPVDPKVNPEWLGAAGNRFVMRVISDCKQIARAHMFASVDGPVELSAFNGDLTGYLAGWFTGPTKALYGDSPADAFRVVTGSPVNTTQTIQNRQLNARLSLKIAPNARFVNVTITNRPLTEAL